MMEQISIVIPIKINYPNRKKNILCVLDYLLQYPYLHIDIMEAGESRQLFLHEHPRVRYTFVEDVDKVFYHTYYRNQLLLQARHPIVGVWDADCIVLEEQILKATEYIRKGCVMCFPYDGDFRYLGEEESEQVRQDLTRLQKNSGVRFMGRPSVGGIFFVNRETYLRYGGDNECFYGWSPEDAERVKRMEVLELPVARTSGSLYHLFHEREPFIGNDFQRAHHNRKALIQTCRLCKEDIEYLIRHRTGMFEYMRFWNLEPNL